MSSPFHARSRRPVSLAALALFLLADAPAGAANTPANERERVGVTPPTRERFHVYLLMGQSNMAGRDTRHLATQVENPRVLALDSEGRWVVAKDPIHAKVGRVEPGAGPGIPFAVAMAGGCDPAVVIGLVPCAVGGSPLRRWEKGGDLYAQALARARIAAEAGTVRGVLWHQGESDTAKPEAAASYEERLSRMIGDLRSDLERPDLPVVVGQLGEFMAAEKHPHAETVRAALRRLSSLVSRVGYADSAGLGHKGDQLHFDTAASAELGARFARAMLELGEAGPARVAAEGALRR